MPQHVCAADIIATTCVVAYHAAGPLYQWVESDKAIEEQENESHSGKGGSEDKGGTGVETGCVLASSAHSHTAIRHSLSLTCRRERRRV